MLGLGFSLGRLLGKEDRPSTWLGLALGRIDGKTEGSKEGATGVIGGGNPLAFVGDEVVMLVGPVVGPAVTGTICTGITIIVDTTSLSSTSLGIS